jgi:type IV pilus assembly protein PilC
MRPHENVFGPLFINMIESGEISGNLEKVLKILARQMARDHELRSRVRGALIYPVIVFGALIAVGVLMMIWVVPTLTQTFTELGIVLPVTTRIIIASSNLLLHYGWYVAGLAILLLAVLLRLLRSPVVRRVTDTLILKVPIFGPLVQRFNSARFARTLASLISSGIPITRSLEVTASVLGNVNFRAAVEAAREAIGRGHQLAGVLQERPELFPPLVIQMIQVGEETGTLSRMLLRLALFYEEEVAAITKNLSSIVEPVLMIIIGSIVGFFAISMIQPIYGGLGNL